MTKPKLAPLPKGRAICYSGYRHGQSPDSKTYPSLEQISEDLRILAPHWPLLRLYDSSTHADRVLEVIRRDGLPFKVMLGAYLGAEMNNFGCPWGGTYSEQQLEASVAANEVEIGRLIALANANPDVVFSVAVGNEATVDWTDHFVPVHRMIEHVRRVKRHVKQPVTFCENYVPWQHKLRELVAELDFVSLHTYPVWESKHIHEALAYTRDNYDHHRSGMVHQQQRPWHERRACGAGVASHLPARPDGLDRRGRHPVLRLRSLRRTVEGLARPAGAGEALGPVHGRPAAQARDDRLALKRQAQGTSWMSSILKPPPVKTKPLGCTPTGPSW
jgi:hypothetical protein